ncbi:MAG: formimidoylglutamate deiminase [Hyphomicrobiaceae bacterium]
MTTALFADLAFTSTGWQRDVRLELTSGVISSVTASAPARPGDERVGCLIPGLPNLHSHAFQRGMAGLAEWRGPGSDDFWSWREVMYKFAHTMSPDQMEIIATQAYVEMLESGFTRVGEFHYLHHDSDGRAYADIGEMASRICAAAAVTGIGLTLLPVFYAHGNFGAVPATPGQRRFITSLDCFVRLLDRCEAYARGLEAALVGVAPHSLRAVTPEELVDLAGLRPNAPIHMHISEQTKEVDDCLAWCGRRPVAWLLDTTPVDGRWCLVHATHMDGDETKRLAASGAVAGLCPVTEANLGDGIFNSEDFQAADGRYGVGTDSNILISAADELRQLEYAQRLRERRRNVLATSGASSGTTVFSRALQGGSQALGVAGLGIAAGGRADLVGLDLADAAFAGSTPPRLVDAWIFAARRPISAVWVGGKRVVTDGRHHRRSETLTQYRRVVAELLSD